MHIPFLDLRRDISPRFRDEMLSEIGHIVENGIFIGGDIVADFEKAFANYCATSHAVGCGNGLDAIYLGLRALNIGPGDEVIVPAHTFIATWLAVSRTGATIVPVDVRPDTGCIDEKLLWTAISERTKVVIVVHLYGHIPDMDAITAATAQGSISLIEDAAQAHGAKRNGRPAGSFGDLAAFSFYPTKNLGAWGDAGAITTNDESLANRVQRLQNYGQETRDHFSQLGTNSRLDPMQAAVLYRKLNHLDALILRKKRIAEKYDQVIAAKPGLRRLLAPQDNCVWHQYVVVADDRRRFREYLTAHGIGTDIHYPVPPYRQKCYAHLDLLADMFPVSEFLASRIVSLPIGSYLSERETDHICRAILSFE